MSFFVLLIETVMQDGSRTHKDWPIGHYDFDEAICKVQELYIRYGIQGGYAFSTDSIATRLASMDSVICWFGGNRLTKYSCYLERIHEDEPVATTSLPPLPASPPLRGRASNGPNYLLAPEYV